jgi:predicted metal-dependent enzyme (double-stranded beta helix superfamily)
MAYELSAFTRHVRQALIKDPGPAGREEVRLLLEKLLRDQDFIQRYCGEDRPAKLEVLYEDPDLGFQVLAHINGKARVSPPHDHGESWAIYGQATRYTDVTEWERADDRAEIGHADLKAKASYRLEPGHAAIYQDGMIHSIDYPDRSRFVRVTGTNLDRIPRVMFDLKTGKITRMTPQQAS